jgi:filamentous hemagglutinin family protein
MNNMIRKFFIGFFIYLVGGFTGQVFALPQGGEVVSGTVGINTPGVNDMAINQGSDQAIVNWQGFDIGQQESVTINQPNSNSVILNRVIGENPSAILGKLSANGKVFLTNPSGILFGQGAQVNVGALVASTLNISNQDFLNRNYRFTQDANKPLASIINLGDINAGSVGLLAPSVENRGTILASLGSVALASGEKAALDFEGDGLINFEITQPVNGEIRDSDGNVLQSGVVNSGLIQANGGRVVLSALQAQGMIQSVVNNEGMIEAKGVEERDGKIFLLGADEVLNSGTLDVSNNGSGRTGGTIHVLGDKVGVFGNAHLNASGDAGGGTILIGGDFQGKNDAIQNAYRTFVGSDAVITADATNAGNGGKVIVWADDTTFYYGSTSVKGGAISGNGGFVETSGKGNLDFHGQVDTSAANGEFGILLLDPTDATIVSSGGEATVLADVNNFTDADIGGSDTTIDVALITGQASGTVIIQATQDILLSASTDVVMSANVSLVLQAGRNITLNSNITLSGSGTLHIEADTPHSAGGSAASNGTGTLTIASSQTLTTANQQITLIAADFVISGNVAAGSGNVNVGQAQAGGAYTLGSGILADSELSKITTTGTLTIGSVTTKGTDGAGTSAVTRAAGVITIDGVTNSSASTFNIVSGTNNATAVSFTAGSSFQALNVSTLGGILISASLTTNGTTTLTTDTDNDNNSIDLVTISGSAALNTTGNNLVITSNGGLNITSATINTGAGDVTIRHETAGRTICLGSPTGCNLDISTTELNNISATNLTIGDSVDGGSISVGGLTLANTDQITGTINLDAKNTGADVTFGTTSSVLTNGIAVEAADMIVTDVAVTGSGSINFTAGGMIDINDTVSASGGVSLSASGTLDVAANKQVIATGSSSLSVSAVGITLHGSSSAAENLQNTGTGGISITSTGAIALEGDYSIGIAGTGALTIGAGNNSITTTGSGSNPDIFLSGGTVNITSGAFGSSGNFIRTNGMTSLAMSTSGSIFLINMGSTNITSALVNSIDGIVASSGNINITNNTSTSGFIFNRIILASNGNITLVSNSGISDGNGTATSLSAPNGTVMVTISSSGNFGSSGNPIEISAQGRSISLNSGTIFDSFTDTTPGATTTEETTATEETTTPITCTAALAAEGVCTFTGTCTEALAATGICTLPTGPTPPGDLGPDDLAPIFGPLTTDQVTIINDNNKRGQLVGFVEAIEGIVKGPGC